jgi:hypothetical protein
LVGCACWPSSNTKVPTDGVATTIAPCIAPQDAANRARQFDKLLVIYLHSGDHPNTGKFCRDVLSHPSLVNLINDQAFLWGADVEHQDGYRLAVDLAVPTFPFFGVIAAEGSRKNQRLKLLLRCEGWNKSRNVDTLVTQLQSVLVQHETTIVGRHANRNEAMERQRLREEQDNALKLSMEQVSETWILFVVACTDSRVNL